jgi:hypothetical protein
MEALEELSAAVQARSAEYFASEAPAPADLYEQFAAYFNGQLTRNPQVAPSIRLCVRWTVTGPAGGEWAIDFRRDSDWVCRGIPDDWNLHITIPDRLVFKGVSGQGIWDDIILSFRVRLARRPDRYMKEFWTWFSKV